MCRIEFHAPAWELKNIAHPYPATRQTPDWFKDMPMDTEGSGTLKRCPPFIEAMTAGYIIPVPVDFTISMAADSTFSVLSEYDVVSSHSATQYRGSPFQNFPVLKFHNPWIIVTPRDYVCLITGPMNRFGWPFMPLAGIVETGEYYHEVHLPMFCMMQPGQSFTAPRGAPMIQVIPMRREAWNSEVKPLDISRRADEQKGFQTNVHAYKQAIWKKIVFS